MVQAEGCETAGRIVVTFSIIKIRKDCMVTKVDAPGMRGYRTRDDDGELRKKRSDTHIKTIEELYNVDLKLRGDKHLAKVLEEQKVKSLDELLKKIRKGI